MAGTPHHGYGHSRSRSEPFSVAHLTNPEPPPLPTQQPQQPQLQNIATQPIAISPKEGNEGSANGEESPDKGDSFNGAPKKTESEKKKPFKCDRPGCGMAFSRQEHLLRHIRKHTGEKPFHCRICGNSFSRLDNLRQHSQCHERKRRIRNNRRLTNMPGSESGEFVATGDQLIPQEQVVQEQLQQQQQQQPPPPPPQQQPQYVQQQHHQAPPQQHIHQAIYPHAAPIRNIPPPPIQTQSQVVVEEPVRTPRRRPDPIVLAPESRFQRQETVTTPPESPASTAAYGNAGSPTPFSPPYQSYNSVVGTPTSANFVLPSPSLRSDSSYNSSYNANRFSWSLLDSASNASSFVSSPAEARTPKFGRRQTVATPSLNGINLFPDLEGQQQQQHHHQQQVHTPSTDTLGSGYNSPRSSIQSPRQPPIPPPEEHYGGGGFGNSRPKTWHGGPPPNLLIPNTPSPPIPTNPAPNRRILLPVLNREPGSRSNRNSQIYSYGGAGRPTLEPEIPSTGAPAGMRSQADSDALKALGQMPSSGGSGHRRSESQAEKRKSGVWDGAVNFDLKNVKMQKRSDIPSEHDIQSPPPPPPLPTVIANSSRMPRRGVAPEKRLSITSPINEQQRQIANYSTYGSLATRPVMSPQQDPLRNRRPVSMYDVLSAPQQPPSISAVAGLHSMSASPTPSTGSNGGPVRLGPYREYRDTRMVEVPRSIGDERGQGMGGLCALVSAVELQGRNG